MERNSVQGPQNEIWWKAVFLSNLCDFFEKRWYMLWSIGIFFSYFWSDLKIFLNPRLSLIVPLSWNLANDAVCLIASHMDSFRYFRGSKHLKGNWIVEDWHWPVYTFKTRNVWISSQQKNTTEGCWTMRCPLFHNFLWWFLQCFDCTICLIDHFCTK